MFPRLFISCFMCLLFAAATAIAGLREAKALHGRDYERLEQSYARAAAETVTILTTPRLEDFFGTFKASAGATDNDWQSLGDAIDAWHQARPDSKAAVLAQAHLHIEHAHAARGTVWASQVPAENWKIFHQRLAEAQRLLDENQGSLFNEVEFHYLLARIKAPFGAPFDGMLRHIGRLRELSPNYWPAYDLAANYLLERWGARPGELEAYARAAADTLGGEDGDILYARMLGHACYMDEDRFKELHHPDATRLFRGYEAILNRVAADNRWRVYFQSGYAYAAGVLGDWTRARSQLVMLQPVNYFAPWNGRANYDAHMARSGAAELLASVARHEAQGDLYSAERLLLSVEPDPPRNFALLGFFLRHGREADFFNFPGSPSPDATIDSLSPDQLAFACRYYSALRLHGKAREAALRFDKLRGHDITGKLALYQCAIASGDAKAIKRAREAIITLKTNRAAYKLAQDFLADPASAIPSPDWGDAYASQAVTAIALGCIGQGQFERVAALLGEAANHEPDLYQRELLRSLLLHPRLAP